MGRPKGSVKGSTPTKKQKLNYDSDVRATPNKKQKLNHDSDVRELLNDFIATSTTPPIISDNIMNGIRRHILVKHMKVHKCKKIDVKIDFDDEEHDIKSLITTKKEEIKALNVLILEINKSRIIVDEMVEKHKPEPEPDSDAESSSSSHSDD